MSGQDLHYPLRALLWKFLIFGLLNSFLKLNLQVFLIIFSDVDVYSWCSSSSCLAAPEMWYVPFYTIDGILSCDSLSSSVSSTFTSNIVPCLSYGPWRISWFPIRSVSERGFPNTRLSFACLLMLLATWRSINVVICQIVSCILGSISRTHTHISLLRSKPIRCLCLLQSFHKFLFPSFQTESLASIVVLATLEMFHLLQFLCNKLFDITLQFFCFTKIVVTWNWEGYDASFATISVCTLRL